MNKITWCIRLAILVGISISACKPVKPVVPSPLSTMALANNPPTITSEVPTSTFIPPTSPSPTLTPIPEAITTSPGWTTYPNIESIKGMIFDQVGNLWAVGAEGVFVLKPDGTILHYTTRDGLPNNDTLSVGQDTNGNVWVGTNGSGAARFDGQVWQTFTTSDGLIGNVVLDLVRYTGARGILAGTDHGISWYDGEKWENYAGPAYLPNDEVTSIITPRWDTVWVGTLGGVRLFETSQSYTIAQGLASNEVNDIAVGADCSLWVGTKAGVSHLSEGKWTSYSSANGLSDDRVTAVAVTLEDVIWLGTPSGLSRFDGKTWTTYTTDDGLADNHVLSVIVAPNETVWIGTSGGLTHYSPSLASPTAETGQSLLETKLIDTGHPLTYIKGGDLWTWSAGVKKQVTTFGNISGYLLSGDRSKVAIFRHGNNNETSLWVMNMNGSEARLLVSQDDLDALGKFSETDESRKTNSRVSFRGTAWVPGSLTIAYGTHRYIKYDGTIEHDDLNLVDAETGAKKILLPPGSGGGFAYSPDGSQIAIIGQNQISIMDADGSNRHDKVLEYPTIHDIDNFFYPRPIWSPDGEYLLLALPPERPMDDPTPPTTLWKIPADGSPAIQLGSISPSFTYAFSVAYSPDQTRLAYWSMDFGPSGPTGEVHIANYDGTDDKVMILGSMSYFVNWSPDGQHFVYYTSSDDSEVWYISDLSGVSTPLAIKPVYITWVTNELFLQYDSLPCARFEMRLTSIHGDSQVIDRFWFD